MPIYQVTQDNDTLLQIFGMGVPRWSMRAGTEKLEPIEQSNRVTRSINGRILNFSQEQFRKYRLTLSCTDHRQLRFDGIWPGMEVTIECISELAYPVGGEPGREVIVGTERPEGDYIWYRPQLQMVFIGFNADTPEWEGRVAWEAVFEEV